MENKDKENTIHAGICMAGAISAGAYTAGVIDYLLEALEHWEKAKELQNQGQLSGVPKHNFSIEVLGGASAGGMTAAVTTAGVQSAFSPVSQANQNDEEYKRKNPVYDAWVNLIETDKEDMVSIMLDTSDIDCNDDNKNKEVRAGLNSKFIEQIAERLTLTRNEAPYERKYFANDLDVFTTVTNLRGFHYKVTFNTSTGPREHRMIMHKDYAFFRLTNNDYSGDGRIPIHFNHPKGLNTDIFAQAAMSTGAFPIGLESRELKRKIEYIKENKYLNLRLSDPYINSGTEQPVNYNVLPTQDFVSLNVDGGVINNEPYEITQQLLDDRRRMAIKGNNPTEDDELAAAEYTPKTSAGEFDSLVLMIDPFPNDEEADDEYFVPKKAWRNVVPAILSAMRGQLMMKDDQIRRAYLSEDYTRFLIMPSRTKDDKSQRYSLACGSLGGFGGFFSKDFRVHDFYLGRRNCQRFLQNHFSAPTKSNNPILKYGYEDIINYRYIVEKKELKTVNGAEMEVTTEEEFLPIIPDLRVVENKEYGTFTLSVPTVENEFPYPQLSLKYILGLEAKIEKRISCILDNIKNPVSKDKDEEKSPVLKRIRKKNWLQEIKSWSSDKLVDLYFGLGKWQGKGVATTICLDAIIRDMETRELLKDDYK